MRCSGNWSRTHGNGFRLVEPTVEAMEQLAAMGMEEGPTQAVGQIDEILAEDPVEAR
jgi:hypothetical protein